MGLKATPQSAYWWIESTSILTILPATGKYVRIGDAGTTSHTLNTNDDLFVSGKFEVDGLMECDGSIDVYNGPLYFGGVSSSNPAIVYNVVQTPDSPILGVGQSSRSWIICENADASYDFAHAIQTNPTVFIHSAAQSTTQWLGITHNGTDGVLTVGTGLLRIPAVFAGSGDVACNGSISIKIADGSTVKLMTTA